MADPKGLTLRLSSPELVYLQEILTEHSPNVPYDDLLPNYDEGQRQTAAEVARQGLFARGLLTLDEDGQDQADPTLVAIIAATLMGDRAVVVTTQEGGDEPWSVDFHRFQDVYLAHRLLAMGVHEYGLFSNRDSLVETLSQTLNLKPPGKKDKGLAFDLSAEALAEGLTRSLDGDGAGLSAGLIEYGLDETAAGELAGTLGNGTVLKSVAWRENGDQAGGDSLVFLQGKHHLWKIRTDKDNPDMLHLETLSAAGAKSTLAELAEQI